MSRRRGRTVALFALCGMLVATPAWTQIGEVCPECTIGIYDDMQMTRNYGTMSGDSKVLYVGVRFAPELGIEGMLGVEFSIAGLTPFMTTVEVFDRPTLNLGSVAAPADTSMGFGGINLGWPVCSPAERVFMRITLLATGSVPNDWLFQVRRRFPPTNADRPYVLHVMCNGLRRRVSGGCYVLNPTTQTPASDVDCTATRVQPLVWGGVRALYR